MVRRRRTRCAGTHQWPEGRTRPLTQVWRPLCIGVSDHRAGVRHLRPRGRAYAGGELQQHLDPALLRLRRRRYGAVCVKAHRRARDHPGTRVAVTAGHGMALDEDDQRSARNRGGGDGVGDRAAAGPRGVFEVCVDAGVAVGGAGAGTVGWAVRSVAVVGTTTSWCEAPRGCGRFSDRIVSSAGAVPCACRVATKFGIFSIVGGISAI